MVTTLTLEDLYGEISDLARDQGVASKEQWDELVEDVVEDHLELGELDLDQDTEGMKEVLGSRWVNYKKESELSADGVKDEKYEEDEKVTEPIEENDDDDFPSSMPGEDE